MEIEIPEISLTNKEIPVAPPSMKLFGSKNPFKPKPAENTPAIISMISLIFLLVEMIISFAAFSASSFFLF